MHKLLLGKHADTFRGKQGQTGNPEISGQGDGCETTTTTSTWMTRVNYNRYTLCAFQNLCKTNTDEHMVYTDKTEIHSSYPNITPLSFLPGPVAAKPLHAIMFTQNKPLRVLLLPYQPGQPLVCECTDHWEKKTPSLLPSAYPFHHNCFCWSNHHLN